MAHNFDVHGAYFEYFPDAGHYWTDVVNIALFNYTRSGTTPYTFFAESMTPEEVLEYWRQWSFWSYLRYPGASWERCVRDVACQGLEPKAAEAGFFHRVYQLFGPRVLEGYLRFMRDTSCIRSGRAHVGPIVVTRTRGRSNACVENRRVNRRAVVAGA